MNRGEPRLALVDARQQVWRVGYLPQPWAWSGWQYATAGRFTGRWDDRDGNFRTTYAGSTLLGCLLEVLPHFRPDTVLAAALSQITDNGPVGSTTAAPGLVPRSWFMPRGVATAQLRGTFCAVSNAESIAALRPVFVSVATRLGLDRL